jgi:hypothetical protein
VIAVGIAVAPEVALASPPTVRITSLTTEVASGAAVDMEYVVADTNNGQGADPTAQIQVTGMRCSTGCNEISEVSRNGRRFTAKMTAPTVNAGASQNVTVEITATINGETSSTQQTVAVQGPDKPATVTRVSGTVRDQGGKSVSGAQVAIKDSAGNAYSATTNGSGGYSFNSSDSEPIIAGQITIVAFKQGFESAKVTIQATAGRSVNQPLTLKLQVAATTATPSASASAEASEEAVDPATDDATTEATQPAADPASGDGGSGSWLFLLLGGLLVAAGVGTIVLVVMRRRNAADSDDDDPNVLGGGRPGLMPTGPGRFNDATRVAAPMGAGRDATMVTPLAGAGSLGEAPTMLHRSMPADDEFADPYGVPIPQQGGYHGQGGNGYGEPSRYGSQQDDDGYAAGTYARGGGYSDQRRYDEPTSTYRPESDQDDGYRSRDRGGSGYGSTGQYGGGAQSGGYDRGGYDDGRDGYGPRSGSTGPSEGTYGASAQTGGAYDDGGRGGYGGQAGYDQRGAGYGRSYGDQGDAFDEDGYGTEPRGGRARQESQPGQRRSADWTDN